MAFSIEGMARDMLKTRKGMPRYLEMLGKAREAGTVPKDTRGPKRSGFVGVPKAPSKPRLAYSAPVQATVPDLHERYRRSQLAAIASTYSKRDATDSIKSSGNGL